jgi:hypothetical protein
MVSIVEQGNLFILFLITIAIEVLNFILISIVITLSAINIYNVAKNPMNLNVANLLFCADYLHTTNYIFF